MSQAIHFDDPGIWTSAAATVWNVPSAVWTPRTFAVESSAYWYDNLHRAVFKDEGCTVKYVTHGGQSQVKALLPLRYSREHHIRWIASLSNYYTSLFEPLLFSDAGARELEECLHFALADSHGADAMRFAPMDPDCASFRSLFAAIRGVGWVPFRYFCFGNWYLRVQGSWAAYLAQREGALRSTIKRKGKKFDASGGQLEVVTTSDNIESAIDAYNTVYGSSWKQPEPFPSFIPGLVRSLAETGELRLGIAWLGEKPIASQIWFVKNGKASIFKLAYDEQFAELGAGTLLTACLMEHVIDRDRVVEVDYLIGDDSYKKSWMDARRERWGIVAYNPGTALGLFLLSREVAGRGAKHLVEQFRKLLDGGRERQPLGRRPSNWQLTSLG